MIRRPLFRNLDSIAGEKTFAPVGERRLGSKRHLEMVYGICVALMQSLEVDEICERIVSALLECLKRIDHVCICLVDQETGGQRRLLCRSRDGKITDGAQESVSRVIDRVIRERKPFLRQDTRLDDPEGLSRGLSEQYIKSIMCIPLLSNRVGILGAICVLSRRESKGFRRDDTIFLTSLSIPAALAIENAILYEKSVLSEETFKRSRDLLRQEVEEKTSELLEANLRLRELSITDGLTNLYNHRYLMKMIDLEYRRALRYDRNLALLMVDVDNFKYCRVEEGDCSPPTPTDPDMRN
ncbi:MAG: GAF domain-containing protein [Deltaproteobacteria bacterium]|nr:GAF domain-containing protein [Deltaproteobacteria bacterium]MBW2137856.1 GAF domain-containing protein [Deltaproteobacteria bacterium]